MKESFTFVLLFLNNGIRNSSENYGFLTLAISGVETKTSKFLIPVNVEIDKSKLSKFVANSESSPNQFEYQTFEGKVFKNSSLNNPKIPLDIIAFMSDK